MPPQEEQRNLLEFHKLALCGVTWHNIVFITSHNPNDVTVETQHA